MQNIYIRCISNIVSDEIDILKPLLYCTQLNKTEYFMTALELRLVP